MEQEKEIIALLSDIADAKEIVKWLDKPLPEWGGRTPRQELDRGNIEGVRNLANRIKNGEGGF